MRGAHLHGRVDALQAREAERLRALHAPWRARHQPLAQQSPAAAAGQCAHRATVNTVAGGATAGQSDRGITETLR